MKTKFYKKKAYLMALAGILCVLTACGFAAAARTGTEPTEGLVRVGNKAQLSALLQQYYEDQEDKYDDVVYKERELRMESAESMTSGAQTAPQAMNMKAAADTAADAGGGYSQTNVQVQGVDEADLIKTDGKYIYKINGDQVLIVQANPPEAMKVLSTLSYTDSNFTPSEMYVEENRLVVLGRYWTPSADSSNPAVPLAKERAAVDMIMPYPNYYGKEGMRLLVYDTTDKSAVEKVREFDMEGSYLTSRKIGSYVYLVTNKNTYYPYYQLPIEPVTPFYRDEATSSQEKEVAMDRIWYCPGEVYPSYVLMGGINVASATQPAQVEAYLGRGENVYASLENMYIAVSSYREDATKLFKFALDKAEFTYKGQGQVNGHILNQFSMDENDGNFRIATTSGSLWGSGEDISKNNLYILDSALKPVGQIEGIAPGEKIYSARFMGERAYMVTFRTVDPFFVLELKNPAEPKVLGQLKIPGYSDYLHPYDENHVIGFGKETIELKNRGDEPQAYYLGMKLSLFDVTDVENPVEKFKTVIGDRGTDSALLYDHKALLFSPEKNLLAFPVTVMELKGKPVLETNRDYTYPNYGEFTYQGAYIYHLDMKNGFNLKGKVTHISASEYQNAGNYWYDSEKNIQRLLYIGNTLYSASNSFISANDLTSMAEKGRVALK